MTAVEVIMSKQGPQLTPAGHMSQGDHVTSAPGRGWGACVLVKAVGVQKQSRPVSQTSLFGLR